MTRLATISLVAALAMAAGGCSSQRQSTSLSESHGQRVLRIDSRDSTVRVLAAIIDSPEIVIESPTLPGGRATVRGRRLKTAATSSTVSGATATAEAELDTTQATTSQRHTSTGPSWRTVAVLCAAAAIIFFISGYKLHK